MIFHIRSLIWALEALILKFVLQKYLGTTMVYPYYYEILLIHLHFSIDNMSMERTNVTSQLNMVPKWYPKTFFRKIYILSFLTPCQSSVQSSQIKSCVPFNVHDFLIFHQIYKNITFSLKIMKNLQSLQGCKTSPRLHNGTCNTAFESLNVIVLNTIIFGYHNGTQNT